MRNLVIVFIVMSALVAACSESAYGEPSGWRVAEERGGASLTRDMWATAESRESGVTRQRILSYR
ncbi:hypothetical protein ACIBHX_47660 [Nonomuraea sp. NPDC050536]|uniref:hypothetical protein n=1 Tax=Nonomuraea sp. NPDC050536 TaxID=3364366 RepID=UPI0037C7C522